MSHERIIMVKRTLHVFQCPSCDYRKTYTENPPKELRCPSCGPPATWIGGKTETYTGPDKFREAP